jgi:Tn3 transposase DDE domain
VPWGTEGAVRRWRERAWGGFSERAYPDPAIFTEKPTHNRDLCTNALRREIHEGLEVIENWNSANDFILYGKGGEFTSNKLENQEILMLSLHLLQVSLVYVNTLMIQQVLSKRLPALEELLPSVINRWLGGFFLDRNELIA